MLINPTIDESTDFSDFLDVEFLEGARSGAVGGVRSSIAAAIKNSDKMNLQLSVLVKRGVAWKSHGPGLQKHIATMKSLLIASAPFSKQLEALQAALLDLEKYSASMPDGSLASVKRELLEGIFRFAENILSESEAELSDYQSTQTLLQTTSRTMPQVPMVDTFIERVAEKLRNYSAEGKLNKLSATVHCTLNEAFSESMLEELQTHLISCVAVELNEAQAKLLADSLEVLWSKCAAMYESNRDICKSGLKVIASGAHKCDTAMKNIFLAQVSMTEALINMLAARAEMDTPAEDPNNLG